MIADDHAFTLSGMKRAFEAEVSFDVIATASNGLDAIRLAKQSQPDVALLDYVLPDMTGLEVMLELHRWSPETKVVMVTGSTEASIVQRLHTSGAAGIFFKGDTVDNILAGVMRIAAGEAVLGNGVAQKLTLDTSAPVLSPREIEVLTGIAEGLSNAGVADKLGISPKTVDTHRTNLMRKLDANSTARLLMQALRHGLIDH